MAAFPKPAKRERERKPLRSSSALKTTATLRATRWGIKKRRPRRLTPRDPALIAAFEQLAKLGGDFKFKTRPNADPTFVAWAHDQSCTFARYIPGHRCHGSRIVFCHEGPDSGMALKAPDQQGFAGCEGGHQDYTGNTGEFRTWKKADRRAFEELAIEAEYARYLSAGSRRGA